MGVVRNVSNKPRSLTFLQKVRVVAPNSQAVIRKLLLSEYVRYRKDASLALSGDFDLCIRVYSGRYAVAKSISLPVEEPVVNALPETPTIEESETPVSEDSAPEPVVEAPAPDAEVEIGLSPAGELKRLYEESGLDAVKIAYGKPALTALCEELGLESDGTKVEQIERIVQSLQ